MTDNTLFERRTVLASTAAVLGGAGAYSMLGTQPSAGALAGGVEMAQGDISVESDDGTLNEVTVSPVVNLSWQGFDDPIDAFQLSLEFRVNGKSHADDKRVQSAYTTTFSPETAATSGDFTFNLPVRVHVWQYDEPQSHDTDAAQPSSSDEYTVKIKYTLTALTADETEIGSTQGETTFTVHVDIAENVQVSGAWNAEADA